MRISELHVGEAMSQTFGRIDQNYSLGETIDLMLENGWNEAVIFDENQNMVGMVTKENLVRMLSEGSPRNLSIAMVCSSNVITTRYEENLVEARDVMRRYKIGRLPVMNDEEMVVGVLTAKDVCNGFSTKLELLGQHMYAVMENITEAIQVINCQGIVSFWNYGAEKLFGIKADEIIGKPLKEFFPGDILLRIVNTLEPCRDLLCELENGAYVVRNAVPVINSFGKVEGAVCTTLDVSQTKALIDELDQANNRVKKLERKIGLTKNLGDEAFYTVNAATQKILAKAQRVGMTDATVLIQGESGTGKEVMANVVYSHSKRTQQPLIQINCSAIPETLFESEMFGYEAGTFTGGNKSGKKGKFELANGGTIFLDEIGELPLNMQAKLLRVIQEKRFYRVGGTTPIVADVRIIAATNRDIPELILQGKFREDLYYRLNVVTLEIPPLRERREDIQGLVNRFINDLAGEYEKNVHGIDPEVLQLFINYDWPGNVRQLRNMLEGIIILMEDEHIDNQALVEAGVLDLLKNNTETQFDKSQMLNRNFDNSGHNLDCILEKNERELIIKALGDCNYNKAQAASRLGIPRSTLYYKIKALGIQL